jgi:hypothetical protein
VTKRPLTEEAVEYAARRLDDLHQVHVNETPFERVEAMGVVLDSFGDRSTIVDITRWFDERGGALEEHQALLLGVLFGLLIARYHDE